MICSMPCQRLFTLQTPTEGSFSATKLPTLFGAVGPSLARASSAVHGSATPDGTPLPHDQIPMALALKEKRPIRGMEGIAERPDGTRIHFITHRTPLFDASGNLIGAVNMLVDITERKHVEEAGQRLSAIVEFSDDAILSKNLDGIIMSWNRGAERLFGYSADEMIGKSVTILIPAERQDEEPHILGRIRRAGAGRTTRRAAGN